VEETPGPFHLLQQSRTDVVYAHARNREPLLSGTFAAHNPNTLTRDAESFGQKGDQRLVCGALDGRSGEPHEHILTTHTRDFVPFRARDDADVDLDARRSVADQRRNSDRGLSD
jgi:hypothetical protein